MGLDTLAWYKTDLILTQELEMVVADDRHLNSSMKPAIEQCTPADFDRTTWHGRWTTTWFYSACEPEEWTKRYLSLPQEHHSCEEPWCHGPVGRLESGGWQYSAPCSFKIFEREEAWKWKCLDGRPWFFACGDSNFQDTIWNLLIFIMDWRIPSLHNLAGFQLTRNYEMAFKNTCKCSQLFPVSQLFNGASFEHGNLEGLKSITQHQEYRDVLTALFSSTKRPDTTIIIMNSGLHDGYAFALSAEFGEATDFMIDFWMKVYESHPADRRPSTMIWHTTVTTAGIVRGKLANPMKMEVYNRMNITEKLQRVHDRLPVKIVDGLDLSVPLQPLPREQTWRLGSKAHIGTCSHSSQRLKSQGYLSLALAISGALVFP